MTIIGLMGAMNVGKVGILKMFVDFVETHDCGIKIESTYYKGESDNKGKVDDFPKFDPNRVVFSPEKSGGSSHKIIAVGGNRDSAFDRRGIITLSRIARQIVGVFSCENFPKIKTADVIDNKIDNKLEVKNEVKKLDKESDEKTENKFPPILWIFILILGIFAIFTVLLFIVLIIVGIFVIYSGDNTNSNPNSNPNSIRHYDFKHQFQFYDLVRYMPKKISVILTNLDKVTEDDRERKLEDIKNDITSYFKKRRIIVEGFSIVYLDTDKPELKEYNNDAMLLILSRVGGGLAVNVPTINKVKSAKYQKEQYQYSPTIIQKPVPPIKKSYPSRISQTSLNTREKIKDIDIKREYEFFNGQIRFKIGVINNSNTVITDIGVNFMIPKALKWISHEPHFKRTGDTIKIPRLSSKEKISINLYLEPISCMSGKIRATISYLDALDKLHSKPMEDKMFNITCPIFFTNQEINLARVNNLYKLLSYKDKKAFSLPSDNLDKIFSLILVAVSSHHVKQVSKDLSVEKQEGEAIYYGITKVKKERMVIKANIDGKNRIIELEVAGNKESSITALLAELENQLRQSFKEKDLIKNEDKFFDIRTSVRLSICPNCGSSISSDDQIKFDKGEDVRCEWCDYLIRNYY